MKLPRFVAMPFVLVVLILGCGIPDSDPKDFPDRSSKIEFINVSIDTLFIASIITQGEVSSIANKIFERTKIRINSLNPSIKNTTADNIKLELNLHAVDHDKNGVQISYDYRIYSKNKQIFYEQDEKDDRSLNDACDKIANRIGKEMNKYI